MAFKRKIGSSQGDVFKFAKIGDTLTGVYGGSVPFTGDFGPTRKHIFKTEDGIKVVFGSKMLNDLLEGEQPGRLVRITFDSTKKMAKGNPLKVFTLDIDDEYQASEDDVAGFVETATTDEDDTLSRDDDEPSEIADEEPAADEVKTAPVKRPPAASTPTAGKAKSVAELLASRKRAG